MAGLFKQAYLPYALVIVGAILIFLWARAQGRREGFENNGLDASYMTAAPYKFHMYYVDWCPHCHAAKPEFDKLIEETKDPKSSIYGKVACDAIEAEKNPEKVKSKVGGYPTFHLYDAEGKMVKEYNGERNQGAFQSFLESIVNRAK